MTYDAQSASQPAEKGKFLLQKYRGEDGGNHNGQGSEWGLGNDGDQRLAIELGPAQERGETALTTTIASTKA